MSRTWPIRYGCARTRFGKLVGVRLTEFNELVEGQFGVARGASLLVDHVLDRLALPPLADPGAVPGLLQWSDPLHFQGKPAT